MLIIWIYSGKVAACSDFSVTVINAGGSKWYLGGPLTNSLMTRWSMDDVPLSRLTNCSRTPLIAKWYLGGLLTNSLMTRWSMDDVYMYMYVCMYVYIYVHIYTLSRLATGWIHTCL